MRTSTGAAVTARVLSAALLLVGGCADGGRRTESSGEVFLETAAAKGPDPFTDSTVTARAAGSGATRTPQPGQSGRTGPHRLSGGTPGLYAGNRGTGSCDVPRQIAQLTSDESRGRAFAAASGITRASIPGYLRGLTSVVLRADTAVTNHGFRDGRGAGYQSVLQAGTAVLVDGHGVPRVRCACGNPLTPAVGGSGDAGTRGRGWSGYRPDRVVVVAPTAKVVTDITIIDIADNTWIERPTGHRGHDRDHALPRPKPVPSTPAPVPRVTAPNPFPESPESPKSQEPPKLPKSPQSPEASLFPETIPEPSDLPDGGGLIPDEASTTDSVFGSPTDSVFGSPTDVFAG